MCGIVGFNWEDSDLLRKMNTTIEHRGPDGCGYYTDKHVSLGNRRLAIIDLSKKANQPMSNKSRTVWITYNGEIYNYKELSKELETKGYAFTTNPDTEVIIHAYQEYGSECVKKFNGMFAFAIWDEQNEELFIARDRFGEKPIFFINHGDGFYFASELNALRTIYPRELTINQDAVIDLVEYLYINLHHSIYQEVLPCTSH